MMKFEKVLYLLSLHLLCSFFSRFGHHIVPLGDNRVLISGGFGCSGNKHQRLRDGVVVDLSEGKKLYKVHVIRGHS